MCKVVIFFTVLLFCINKDVQHTEDLSNTESKGLLWKEKTSNGRITDT